MIVDSVIRLNRSELSKREWKALLAKLTFFDAERNEYAAYRLLTDGAEIPRGAWSLLPDHVRYRDNRVCPSASLLDFRGELDLTSDTQSFTGQEDALQSALQEEQGIIIRGPGTGKTQIALALIAAVPTRALVLVHTEDIFNQWVEYAERSLKIQPGRIQSGDWKVKRLTIAMVQTIREDLDEYKRIVNDFGVLVIDECHHTAAETWEIICNLTPAKYRIGFTATAKRADGMQPLMELLIGPVIHRQKIQVKIPTHVEPIKSGFYFPYRGRFDWGELQRQLIADEHRNGLIADIAAKEMDEGNSVLILSRRIEHLETLNLMIKRKGVVILTGRVNRRDRKSFVEKFRSGEIKCMLATQLADEALDVPRLSRVILTYPGKHDGRIIQQVGRALREFPGKEDAIIYDIVDDRIAPLRRQWMERKRAYDSMGLSVNKYDLHTVKRAVEKRLAAHKIKMRMKGGR